MFKFEITESNLKGGTDPFINQLKERLKLTQGKRELTKKNRKITFVTTSGLSGEIKAGASLLKKSYLHVHGEIRELVTAFSLENIGGWECSDIYFELFPLNHQESSYRLENSLQFFYHDLYESLVRFGEEKSIQFIVMRLTRDAYATTKEIGKWPYVIELKPHKTTDRLFHGVLPLKGSTYKRYQELWNPSEPLKRNSI